MKKEKKKNNLFEIIIIALAVLLVGYLAIYVSGNKDITGGKIVKLSYQEYQEEIKKDDYSIVLFASPTCSHCVRFKPIINQVAEKYELRINYFDVSSKDLSVENYINVHDSLNAFKEKYDGNDPVIPTPTTVLFKSGVEVASIAGERTAEDFLKFLVDNGVVIDYGL